MAVPVGRKMKAFELGRLEKPNPCDSMGTGEDVPAHRLHARDPDTGESFVNGKDVGWVRRVAGTIVRRTLGQLGKVKTEPN